MAEGSRFCENCGNRVGAAVVNAAPDACRCGAGPDQRDSEGYCEVCGRKYEPPDPRDHLEVVVNDLFAAVTDIGHRHKKNEDALAVGTVGDASILVVCDGVSSASHSEQASLAAANVAKELLAAEFSPGCDTIALMKRALAKAHEAACNVPNGGDGKPDPPGSTFVAALVSGDTVTLGWAGDSRAYWFDSSNPTVLTQDHSWLNDVVASGQMTLEQALTQPLAHAITQCLGPLNEEAPAGSYATFKIPGPGRLLVCSDGLWGYATTTPELAALIPESSPLEVARSLIHFALSQGGRDNVTAAVLQVNSSL